MYFCEFLKLLVVKRLFLICFVLVLTFSLYGQNPNCYRVHLSDKNNSPYTVEDPTAYLSQRAIDKRTRFNIPITEQDLPVNPQYKQQILALHPQMQLLAESKWMNTIAVYCTDSAIVQQIQSLPFVDSVITIGSTQLQSNVASPIPENPMPLVQNTLSLTKDDINYGDGFGQIAIHNGHLLHADGFLGEGMLIAVIDAGFKDVENASFYQNMIDQGRLVGRYSLRPDFVDETSQQGSVHGTQVISVMAADESGLFVGTAPKASYALIHSECSETEQPFEEDLLANAFEIADSLGADVINSSLGYTKFGDFSQGNHSYSDMNGHNCFVSRSANLLGEKGIVTCVSAGNSGSNSWYYISTPADAFNILAVGACNIDSVIASFSSRGYSYDGRVKPDITSMGKSTTIYFYYNFIFPSDGTSYSSPVAAGLCACLWQAMPEYTASQIMQIVRESSHLFNNPNPEFGYGIPDFYKAYTSHVGINDYNPLKISVYPNPATDKIHFTNLEGEFQSINIYNAAGQLVLRQAVNDDPIVEINVKDLPKGFYIGNVTKQGRQAASFKFVK